MKRWHSAGTVWLWIGLPLAAAGCGESSDGEPSSGPPPPAEPSPREASPPAEAPGETADPGPARTASPLMNPASSEMNMMAPATFRARFTTSTGEFVIEAHRQWSPHGVDRFFNLVRNGFYDGARFFRVLEGFMAQWGINGDPSIQRHWRASNIADDPVVEGNTRGRVTFAKGGAPNSRSTQLFINYGDNTRLDNAGFSAIGEVVAGMDVVERLHAGYGEGPPDGTGPDQGQIQAQGNRYLEASFPDLDFIERAEIIDEG